jgi:two-component system phosphate regulon sensor histidine kinase PhoR
MVEVRGLPRKVLPVAAVILTGACFCVIAVLQSRWISQLSAAELEHAKIRLQVSVRAVQTDINRELTRAQILFQWESGAPPRSWAQRTSEAYATWRQTAQNPDLIRRVLLVEPGGGGLRMLAFDPAALEYSPVAWPAELSDLRRQLALPFHDYGVFGVRTFTGIALTDGPVMVLPLDRTFRENLPANFPEASAWLLVELDQQLLLKKIIPQTIRDNLEAPDQFEYQVARDGLPDHVLYRSNPEAAPAKFDANCSLLETRREYVRSVKGGNGQAARFPFGENPAEFRAMERLHLWRYFPVDLPGVPPAPPMEGGVWQLQVSHRAGSLEMAAARMRRGNLFLGFAMMALVAASLAILMFSARRAHRLGEARLQFAAGISHELRTPLAAICSAGDNLAAGVAQEHSKVRQYGAAILHQGRQLSDMVEQILAFTSGELAGDRDALKPVEVAEVVRHAVAAVGPSARAAGVTIDEQIPAYLPEVLGDARMLRQSLVNLLQNAIHYGGSGRWIGISVREGNAGELELTVADNGSGIPARELKRIFEPFYRGAASTNSGRRGSGLGLAIVEQTARAHGGRVTVESEPGRGSSFTVHLPAYDYAATNSRNGR